MISAWGLRISIRRDRRSARRSPSRTRRACSAECTRGSSTAATGRRSWRSWQSTRVFLCGMVSRMSTTRRRCWRMRSRSGSISGIWKALSSHTWETPATTWATPWWSCARSSACTLRRARRRRIFPRRRLWRSAGNMRQDRARRSRWQRMWTLGRRAPMWSTRMCGCPWESPTACGRSASGRSLPIKWQDRWWTMRVRDPSSFTACRLSMI